MPRWCVALLVASWPAQAVAGDARWVVVLDPSQDPSVTASTLTRRHGGSVEHVYRNALGGFSFRGSEAAAMALARTPGVRAVVPDRTLALTDVAGWGFFRIDADVVHLSGATLGEGVRIVIVDSGVDLDHPDLLPNLAPDLGLNCLSPGAPPQDDHGHGTHVAGIAAAAYNADGYGVAGIAAGATLVPVKSFDSTGYGSTADVLCGIDHVAALAADGTPLVANLSFADTGTDTACDDADATDVLHEAICDAVDAGAVFVAGAGNSGVDAANTAPAAFRDEVITVSGLADFDGVSGGAAGCFFDWSFFIECDDTLADFSNGGSVIDVAAPAVAIWSTVPDGHDEMTGTSMAAPHVAGVVALMLSLDPTLTTSEIEAILAETGECADGTINADGGACLSRWPDDRDSFGEPLLNAARAVEAVELGAPPPTITLTATSAVLKNGRKRVGLSWNATGADAISVFRDGTFVQDTADDGAWAEILRTRAATLTYRVCVSGTSTCSGEVVVSF